MANTTLRWTVVFSGHVQGVGFRYTTRSAARGFDVTGYVRNLRDGRVEVVAEGRVEELERFIQRVRDEMDGHIQDQQVTTGPATGEFTEFDVRY
jgi:acylphosphatase